jgi:transcriptional regulator with XRE-family HTH domain
MGIVVRFPRRRHTRTSSSILKPKTTGLTSKPLASKASLIKKKRSCEIFPRLSQLLTAGDPTLATTAVAPVPPKASITSPTDDSMLQSSSRTVNMSSPHKMGVECTARELRSLSMAESNRSLAARLKVTREALDVIPAEVCKRLGIGANAWSQYETGARRITLEVAIRFCDEYGVSLDWIYRADPSKLPHELRIKIRAAEAA